MAGEWTPYWSDGECIASCSELHGHPDKEVMDPVLAFQQGGAGEHPLSVIENRIDHLDHGCRGSIVRAAGFQILDDLSASVSRTFYEALNRRSVQQVRKRYTGHARITHQRHHGVAMAAQDKGRDVFYGHIQLLGNKGAEASCVQDAGHSDHPVLGKATDPVRHMAHGIEGIRDYNQNAARRILDGVFHGVLDDVIVGPQQIIPAHPRLAGEAGSQHHNIGVGGRLVVVTARDFDVDARHGAGLQYVQRLALRDTLQNIDHHDVGQPFVRQTQSATCAHVSCPHNCNPFPHRSLLHALESKTTHL